jgi:Raf kinase inhibitor-like YbhB/YbcL family protein
MTLVLTSSAFADGQEIPRDHTCEGGDRSPALAWRDVPAGTHSLALIVDDPDAPDPAAPRMIYVHWVVYNLPPTAAGLPEGVTTADLPPGALVGVNDFGHRRYGGPCPPVGRHRYFFKLYALDTRLPEREGARKADVEKAMAGHVLASAQLVGTYQKTRR